MSHLVEKGGLNKFLNSNIFYLFIFAFTSKISVQSSNCDVPMILLLILKKQNSPCSDFKSKAELIKKRASRRAEPFKSISSSKRLPELAVNTALSSDRRENCGWKMGSRVCPSSSVTFNLFGEKQLFIPVYELSSLQVQYY